LKSGAEIDIELVTSRWGTDNAVGYIQSEASRRV